MKHKKEWEEIKIYGLSNYEINTNGKVRNAHSKIKVPISVEKGSKRFYNLLCKGEEKEFMISELIKSAFGDEETEIFIIIPDRDTAEFSKNEDDYGNRGGGEWREIKEMAKRASQIIKNRTS